MSVIHEATFRVRYAETDQMGIVYYANYFVWMEVGRVEFCRAQGIEYRDMERNDGILLTVAESNCRYHSPALYDEQIVVRTSLAHSHPRMVTFAYEMRCAHDERKLATGFTKHVFCDRALKPTKLPEKYWAHFNLPSLMR
ncbi:MAG TPA: thioesterase family protein [Bryobacteraceae bacterium]|nr:thioesterase family protein [Bryobacteraceae bacterium]